MDLSKLPTGNHLRLMRHCDYDVPMVTKGELNGLFALIDAMRPYMRHPYGCPQQRGETPCTCGLDALLAHIQEPTK